MQGNRQIRCLWDVVVVVVVVEGWCAKCPHFPRVADIFFGLHLTIFLMCACLFFSSDGGGNLRRHGDRAHFGRQGQNPGAAAHPSPAEGKPRAVLGSPFHWAFCGEYMYLFTLTVQYDRGPRAV